MESESIQPKRELVMPAYLDEYVSDIGISHIVELREHNPRYKEIFLKESERILSDFNQLPVSLYHVGSTSVEELCAKPIIDMLLVYSENTAFEDIKKILVNKGYIFRADLLPNRTYFVLEDTRGVRYFSITVHANNDTRAKEILAFRDNLRKNPSIREEYAAIKRRLSTETTNRGEYTNQKSEFIQQYSR